MSVNPLYEGLLNLTLWIYFKTKLIRCYFNLIQTIYKLGFIPLCFTAYFRKFLFDMDSYSKTIHLEQDKWVMSVLCLAKNTLQSKFKNQQEIA